VRWRERRRLDKLSRSGERIEDPQDRQKVQDWIGYLEWFYGIWWWKFFYTIYAWVVIAPYAILVVVRAVQGNMAQAVWDAGYAVGFSLLWLQMRKRRRDLRGTATANGWGS